MISKQLLDILICPETRTPLTLADADLVARLNKAIAICVAEADNGSRELLEGILMDEEEHVDGLEAQLDQIKQMGIQNFLAMQVIEEA